MNFWIKNRFWISGGLFAIGIGIAIFLLMNNTYTILDEELRYAIALASIGTGFTLGQFFFQINENRFQEIQGKETSERDIKREVIKDFIYNSQNLLEIINSSLGSGKYEDDVYTLERETILAYNQLMILVRDYYSIYFKEIVVRSSTFISIISGLSNAVTNMRIAIEKYDLEGKIYDFKFKEIDSTWREFAKENFIEIENQRVRVLEYMREEVQ
jgi:hypothetical protein